MGLRANICYHVATFVIPLKFYMQHDYVLKELNYDPTPRVGESGRWGSARKIFATMLPCCCIRTSLQFDMQHDHVLKKLPFDPTPRVGGGGGEGSAGKIFATVSLHS